MSQKDNTEIVCPNTGCQQSWFDDEHRAKLHTIVDARCLKILCLCAAIFAAITIPSLMYGYGADKEYIRDSVNQLNKKMDSIADLKTVILINKADIEELKSRSK